MVQNKTVILSGVRFWRNYFKN